MSEIEFDTVVGRIEDTVRRERDRHEAEPPEIDVEALTRLMREERRRALWRAERLRA